VNDNIRYHKYNWFYTAFILYLNRYAKNAFNLRVKGEKNFPVANSKLQCVCVCVCGNLVFANLSVDC